MVSKKINQYIEQSYSRLNDYAVFQATRAGIPDEAGDILNTVLEAILKKDPAEVEELLSTPRGKITALDAFILKMINLNTHSPTSPYRHKTRSLPRDANIDPLSIEREDSDGEDADTNIVILEKTRRARDILEALPISDNDKEIFEWKFFGDQPLRTFQSEESYAAVCATYNRVKKMMVRKIKNPHSSRRRWTDEEIRYLRREFPHVETMKIAVYLDRNYDTVRWKASQLGLKKTPFFLRKRLKRNGLKGA